MVASLSHNQALIINPLKLTVIGLLLFFENYFDPSKMDVDQNVYFEHDFQNIHISINI